MYAKVNPCMPPESPNKAQLRQLWRTSYPKSDVRSEASQSICVKLAEALRTVDGPIMAFLAMNDEPDLDPLLAIWLKECRRIWAPQVNWTEKTMAPAELLTPLPGSDPNGKQGPRAPNGPVRPHGEPAVVLVPGVAFTASGSRLGRGGGFYDRFLSTLPRAIPRIGVAFSSQVHQVLPTERHDQPISHLLTDSGWIGSVPCLEQH